ncbi:MAG: hypothetical protein IKQ46_04585 [Bacteroidales bacterium]|nr:hypothetical protein [Bacteroidales bacterium]
MKGLEVSEVWLSEVQDFNEIFRYDAEYFNKYSVQVVKKIRDNKHCLIGEEFDVSKLAGFEFTEYFTPTNMESENFYIALTSKNIQNERIELSNYITIDKNVADLNLSRSKIYDGDVIMSYTGEYRRALTLQEKSIFQLGPNICRLRPKGNIVSSFYLSTFLNSKIGQLILDKEKTLSAQPTVAMSRIRLIPIPILSSDFQQKIETLVKSAHAKLEESKQLYAAAEDQLLSELGLKDWQPKNQNINIKTLKESFLSSGRLDAEYYQSKYDALFTQLSNYECNTLKQIVNINKSVEPGSDAYQDNGIPFVRVSDVDKFGISDPNIFLSPDDFDLQELRPKKDTILLSKDGSVGIAYKVEKDLDCITSGALLHLTVFNQDYNPDYLTLVLNSIIVKMQAERDANGAIIQHWKPSEIEQVIIPKLPMPIQNDISAKIQKSFALKAESKRLLAEAKKMVENEIEKGGK